MNQWIKRIILVILSLAVLGVLLIAGIIVWDTLFPSQTVEEFTNVTFDGLEGEQLRGYLARPQETSTDLQAGILLVHEFFGINADIVRKADLLATQGYTVLAVDAYRGKTTSLIPRAIFLVLSTPRAQIQADLDAGYAYLASQNEVDPSRIGTAGFCFGGTQVMYFATRNPEVAATAIFYGSGPITDPAQLGVMGSGGPVLGIYGEQDGSIPLTEVEGFRQAMAARDIEHTVTVYPGVGHAFVNTESIQMPGAAQDAWVQMLDFFAENLP